MEHAGEYWDHRVARWVPSPVRLTQVPQQREEAPDASREVPTPS